MCFFENIHSRVGGREEVGGVTGAGPSSNLFLIYYLLDVGVVLHGFNDYGTHIYNKIRRLPHSLKKVLVELEKIEFGFLRSA